MWLLAGVLAQLLPLRRCSASSTSLAFVYITQYYTEYRFRPVQEIAEASVAGPATNIIQGIAVGLECVWMPVIVISAAILGSYKLGEASGLTNAGLFGTAVATMGMLGTAGYILAMDTFGPITDNAGGIVEMSIGHDQPEVREKTDKLDSVGNTTKALTKGYAVGSAALAAFLLFSAYIEEVNHYSEGTGHHLTAVNLNKPAVFVGALLGAMLVFWFSALCIKAVGPLGTEGHRRGPPSVQGSSPRKRHDRVPRRLQARLRDLRRHRHQRRTPSDGGPRPLGRRHADRRGPAAERSEHGGRPSSRAPKASRPCSWSARSPAS